MKKLLFTVLGLLSLATITFAQNQYELNTGWVCKNVKEIKDNGTAISKNNYSVKNWMSAVVPGTVLTTLLENKKIPDPFYGMNNNKIPDIYFTGKETYTYWFLKDFTEMPAKGEEQVWLNFRGINYSCDVYLNGKKLNQELFKGMFL
ncbi:MAG: glycosyl hydrolase, partial [Pseudopedobacter saltans]